MEKVLIIFKGVDNFNKSYTFYKVCKKSEVDKVVEDEYRKSTELIAYGVVNEISADTFYGVVNELKRY